jgi:hypothetical protein
MKSCLLTLCITRIGVCKSSKMGIRTMWYVCEHLTNKSHAQAIWCKWLMKMEPILGHKFALDSLHSFGLDLGRGYHLLPYSIFWTSLWESSDSQVVSSTTLWAHNFFKWILIKKLPTTKLYPLIRSFQHCGACFY